MKKIIITISGLILIVALILAAPLFFKPRLLSALKSQVNKNLNAKFEFEDFSISLFLNFPQATLVLSDVSVTGNDAFSADTLFKAASVRASMNLWSVFQKSGRTIEEIYFEKPELFFLVRNSGQSNWEVTKPRNPIQKNQIQTENKNESFQLAIKKVKIENGMMNYLDEAENFRFGLSGINLILNGNLFGSKAELTIDGKAEEMLLKYDSVQYLSKVQVETKTLLHADFDKMNFRISDNELQINRLPLEVTGDFTIPGDSMFINFQFQSQSSDFKNFLALLHGSFSGYLKDIKTEGNAAVSGKISGLWLDEDYPSFLIQAKIDHGVIGYENISEKVEKISGLVEISKQQGGMDLLQIKVIDANAEIKNNPVHLNLLLSSLLSDPVFNGELKGNVILSDLKKVFRLDSLNMSGKINAELSFNGKYSDMEKGNYEKVSASGNAGLNDIVYASPDYKYPVTIKQARLLFSPASAELQKFDARIGESDFFISGKVMNYLGYFFKKGKLKGNFILESEVVNFDQLLRLKSKTVTNSESEKSDNNPVESANKQLEVLAFDIPADLDFAFKAEIRNALYDNLKINNINGFVSLNDGKLNIDGISAKMLQGNFSMKGSYQNNIQNKPDFDASVNAEGFDIPATFASFSSLKKMVPVARQSEGKISTTFNIKGNLSSNLKIIASSVDANAAVSTFGIKVKDSPVFMQLKGILKPEILKVVEVDDFKASCNVVKGNIELKPFNTKISGQPVAIAGTLNTEELLKLRLDFQVDRNAFGPDVENLLSIIPGNKDIRMLPAGVLLTGPVGKPQVSVDLNDAKKIVAGAAKKELKKSVDKLGKSLKDLIGK